jgi:hypothetical protein
MTTPGFTAEVGIGKSATHYCGAGTQATAGRDSQVRAALVAPPICRTSSCIAVGGCKTKVRCCRNFAGGCSCSAVPCFFIGPAELA